MKNLKYRIMSNPILFKLAVNFTLVEYLVMFAVLFYLVAS